MPDIVKIILPIALVAVIALLFFLGWLYCRLFIWQDYDPLYRFLKAIEDTVPIWGSALVLAGVFVLTYHYIAKPLDYLDEVIQAAEQLAQLAEEIRGFRMEDYVPLEGETVMGETYVEFHVDEAALQRLVIEVFYQPAEED